MLEKIAVNAHVNTVYLETILKIIGIAYIAEFASQITKDAGQERSCFQNRIEQERF